MARRLLLLLGGLTMLAACEAKIGKGDDKEGGSARGGEAAASAAEGKAKEGELSIKAPGLDMKIDIPGGIASKADADSDILYPGSTFSGMHIEGSGTGKGEAGLEMRFTSVDAPDKVAAWYRDPARANNFSIESARREGGAILLSGKEKQDGDPFAIRLSPRSGGGTDGRLTISDTG